MNPDDLFMYVIYDHPADLPYWYVARRFENGKPSNETMLAENIDFLRFRLRARGLTKIDRDADDDPKIVETWL